MSKTVWLVGNVLGPEGRLSPSPAKIREFATLEPAYNALNDGDPPSLCVVAAMTPYNYADPVRKTFSDFGAALRVTHPDCELWLATRHHATAPASLPFDRLVPLPPNFKLP